MLSQFNGRLLGSLFLAALFVAMLGSLTPAHASALSSGDVVVYGVGNGSEALTSSATNVFLDEFEPGGSLAATLPFPSVLSGANKPLVDSGSSASDGLLTLSGDGQYLLAVGYDAAVKTEKITETSAKTVPRTVARVNAAGEVDTTTALTDFANENNARSATSSEGTKIWVAGAGGKTGGVHFTTLGSSTSTVLNENDTNVRQVEIVDGQLYTSADPTKVGAVSVATVGSGLPVTKGQTISNLPFETPLKQPFAYSLLTLGLGTAPDTIYVADNELQIVAKYGLLGGKWVKEGAVEVPFVTGVTANDVNGAVTIYATSSGSQGRSGTLYKISDVSGVNGTLSGIPVEIATAPANEAFRGVAFSPGTAIGSGGAPPPAPSISAAENTLPAALGDPTNPSLPITVEDSAYAAGELTVKVSSSNPAVAPLAGISISGAGSQRTVSVTPAAVGTSKLTLTVEAPNGVFASTQVSYGASEYLGDASDRYYSGAGNTGSAVDVGGGYMIVADDARNVLNLYRERASGNPVRSFDFTSQLPNGASEINIHSSARAGNTLYWIGGLDNSSSGEAEPAHDTIFAATITGSGANTELTYQGSYTHLREDLIEWDNQNGKPLGFAQSGEVGQPGERANGFKLEGLEFAAGSTTEAYIAFRAPLETPETRNLALVIPVRNFSSLVNGNPGTGPASFGAPIEWNLGGLSIRQLRKNADDEYLVLASTAEPTDTTFQLYGWNGEPEEPPVLLNSNVERVAEGVWDAIPSALDPIVNGGGVELISDNGNTVWYANGKTAKKGLVAGLQKDLGRVVSTQIPAPQAPGAPLLVSGANPNSGEFTLSWTPWPTLRRTYTLQHQNAQGGWSTVAGGLSRHQYTFASAGHESEGTWTYRVSEHNESGESAYSSASTAIKVDRSAPNTPSTAPSRAADFAGNGGWYKDSVTVSFAANGDPLLADASAGSGVEPASLTAPQTLTTSGPHAACGTVADNAGNISLPGCLTVRVDATPPSLEVSCPATALVHEAGVNATVTASDGESGLASDPSGVVAIETGHAGPVTTSRTAVDNVGHETTRSCQTQVVYPTPGAPALTAGATPNRTGAFTLGWSGDDPLQNLGLSYTLQHHDAATSTWSTVASGIEALSYGFSGGGEAEGSWVYRVQGADPAHGQSTEYSPASAAVLVDRSAPFPPSVLASRSPDYSGGGGWYKDSVELAFNKLADPSLSDGSPGSGIDPASIPPAQTIATSGSHAVCATVADNAGNVSAPGCLTVQVDATPPSLEISCPASVLVHETGVSATITASDGQSGLVSDPSEVVPIGTSQPGTVTVARTVADKVGHETTRSCTTEIFSKIVTGTVAKLAVAAGESVELTSTAVVTKLGISGGALDIEGANVRGTMRGSPSALRICGASIEGSMKISAASGPILVGDPAHGCAPSTFTRTVALSSSHAGVSVAGNVFGGTVKITGNAGGASVTANKVAGSLSVTANTGTVVDRPNEVKGKSKLQ